MFVHTGFAGSGPAGPARVLEFAAACPDGPYREALVRVVANDLGNSTQRLQPVLAQAPVGPALVAFDVLVRLPRCEVGMNMALQALGRFGRLAGGALVATLPALVATLPRQRACLRKGSGVLATSGAEWTNRLQTQTVPVLRKPARPWPQSAAPPA